MIIKATHLISFFMNSGCTKRFWTLAFFLFAVLSGNNATASGNESYAENNGIEINNLDVGQTEIFTGTSTQISVTVVNTGGETQDIDIDLIIDGQTASTKSVTIEAEDSKDVSLYHQFNYSGEFEVAVGSLDPETVTVTKAWSQLQFGSNNIASTNEFTGPSTEEIVDTWSYELGHSASASKQIESAPAIVDGIVYFGDGNGDIHALDAETGDEIWSQETSEYQDATSPAVHDGVVYIANGNAEVHAFDAADGSPVWDVEFAGGFNTSPVIVDEKLLIASRRTVYALDTEDGSELWSASVDHNIFWGGPAVKNGMVFIGAGESESFGRDGAVYAFDLQTGSEIWSELLEERVLGSPTAKNGVVYLGTEGSTVLALEADTGDELWNASTLTSDVTGSPAVYDGTVYVGTENGSGIFAFDADTGDEIWSETTHINGNISRGIVVVDGVIYAGTNVGGNSVQAFDAESGDELWEFETEGGVRSSPALVDGKVLVGTMDGFLYSLGELDNEPEITECRTITYPGTYTIENDLQSEEGEYCIRIESDEVVIEGNEYSITGDNSGTAIVAEEVTDITLRDFTIADWQYGMQIENSEDLKIEDLNIDNIGQAAVWLTNVSDSHVLNNEVTGSRDGIVLREGSESNTIENNSSEESRRYGFIIRDSFHNTLENNTAADYESYGFQINPGSDNNSLTDNTATGTGDDSEVGFNIRGNYNEFEGNLSEGNDREGFRLTGEENILTNNTAADNNRDGIRIVDGIGNTLQDNTVKNSGSHGIRLWNAKNNTLILNSAYGSSDHDFYAHDGSTGNTTKGLSIGSGENRVTLHTEAINVAINPADSQPAAADHLNPVDIYFEVTKVDGESELAADIYYGGNGIEEDDHEGLGIWFFDETEEDWIQIPDAELNAKAETISAELLTEDSGSGIYGVFVDETATSSPAYQELPTAFELKQNYPNPFNPATTIRYDLPENAEVRLTVYDMLGRRVTTLVDDSQSAGSHSVSFDAANLSSGTYIYHLEASGTDGGEGADFQQTRTMMYVK